MLTHRQSDFFIQYIDPDSHTVRSYYPDFVFLREEPDGTEKYVIVEVKADNQIDDAVVQAKKDFAHQIAVASGMEYRLIKSTDAGQSALPHADVRLAMRKNCDFCFDSFNRPCSGPKFDRVEKSLQAFLGNPTSTRSRNRTTATRPSAAIESLRK
jgi:hypothetical protein